jgi:flagellar biosynthesis protein FlhG
MAKIWPIGGGKGGSGKSFLVASVGIQLAKAGKKTLLVDADLGAANLHTIIGVSRPTKSLSDYLNKEVKALEETVVSTCRPYLFLIDGGGNSLEIANLPYAQKMKLLRAIYKLPYEYILLDLGSGTSFNTLDLFMMSDTGIFVATPEPTAIENIYRFIRSVCQRKMKQALKKKDLHPWTREVLDRHKKSPVKSPLSVVSVVKKNEPEIGQVLEQVLQGFRFKLIVNKLRKQDNASLGIHICQICEKHLGLQIQFLGNIPFDERVHDAVCQRVPFVDRYPYTQAVLDLQAICQKILPAENARPMARPQDISTQSA